VPMRFCFVRQREAKTSGKTRWLSRNCNALRAAWAGGRTAWSSKSNLLPRRTYESVLAPCFFLVLLPSRGGAILEGARSLVSNAKGPQNLLVPNDDQRVLESRQGGELGAHLHLEGSGSPSLAWLGPCRLNHRSQQWLAEFRLRCCRLASAHFYHRKVAQALKAHVSELPRAPLVPAWWCLRERVLR